MKILYGVPTTGYGHVIRSKTIIDELSKHAQIDVLLSGGKFGMEKSIEWPNVKYVKTGLDFAFNPEGSVEVIQTIFKNNYANFFKETTEVDLSPYDFVITDSETVSAVAAKTQNKKCLGISNVYAFLYMEPKDIRVLTKPLKQTALKFYGGDENITVFYDDSVGDNFVKPVISKDITNASEFIKDDGHITVYLGTIDLDILAKLFNNIPEYTFHVFSPKITIEHAQKNVIFKNRDHKNFVDSLVSCHGFITAAGFTATSEALYLGKKMMILPINHIEQKFNATYLKNHGVKVIKKIGNKFNEEFYDWEQNYKPIKQDYSNVLPEIMSKIEKFSQKPMPKRSMFNPNPFELLKLIKHIY